MCVLWSLVHGSSDVVVSLRRLDSVWAYATATLPAAIHSSTPLPVPRFQVRCGKEVATESDSIGKDNQPGDIIFSV